MVAEHGAVGGTGAGAVGAAFVIGHPIGHSRSPLIHGHWLKRHAIVGSYEARDVAPSDLGAWLGDLDPGLTPGGNVTVPHKEAVRAWLGDERCDRAARAIGAVNTLWFEEGALRGGNTDAAGFAASLDAGAPEWREAERALVIGAGGAARAVVHALKEAGIGRIEVANRTPARAVALAREFGLADALPLDGTSEALRSADLVANTATLGMAGAGDDGRAPPLHADPAALNPAAITTDIVYVPLETPFLAAAREAGCRTVDGLGMLLHQAVPGFERWFGVRPEVTGELRAAIEATL